MEVCLTPCKGVLGHFLKELRAGKYLPHCKLAVTEDFLLEEHVTGLGVVVGLLEAEICLLVMGAVGNHLDLAFNVHPKNLRCIVHGGISVGLALLTQEERRNLPHRKEGVNCCLNILFKGCFGGLDMVLQGVVVEAEAVVRVCHGRAVQCRGKAAHGFKETRIAVYLQVHIGHNTVIGGALLVEVLVFVGDLLQGIAQVKGVLLLLEVQHHGKLVALLDEGQHAAMLVLEIGAHPLLHLLAAYKVTLELHPCIGHGLVQGLDFIGNCKKRQCQDCNGKKDGSEFLFHISRRFLPLQ